MQGENGAPVPIGETTVVLHVLHFADGTATSSLHVSAAGRGHLLNRPRLLAKILQDHAEELANTPGLILPPDVGG